MPFDVYAPAGFSRQNTANCEVTLYDNQLLPVNLLHRRPSAHLPRPLAGT